MVTPQPNQHSKDYAYSQELNELIENDIELAEIEAGMDDDAAEVVGRREELRSLE